MCFPALLISLASDLYAEKNARKDWMNGYMT